MDAKINKKTQQTKRCKTSILNPAKPFNPFIPILKNGHRTIGTKKVQGIVSTQTCPFVSIFQQFAACYADLPSFKRKVDLDDSQFSALVKNLFSKSEVYNLRNEMLVKLFPKETNDVGHNLKSLDCQNSVHHMFMKLAVEYPILQSFTMRRECDTCTFSSEDTGRSFVPLQLSNINLRLIQKYIKFNDNVQNCNHCSGTTKICRQFNDILVFDTEPCSFDYVNESSYIVNIDEIAETITVSDRQYTLKGIVEYTQRHFLSHIQRNDKEWKTYDDLNSAKIRKTPKRIFPVQLFYAIKGEFV